MARAVDPVVAAAGHLLTGFKRPARLLVAVSGGSDSTGLLVALATLCATGRYPHITLSACTIDHALRAGSAGEALWVEALCVRYGISHVTRRWEGAKPRTGVQAAARARRYDLLVEAANETGADAILTAHTLDDQNETVAMRAERSPDGIGLSGMADAVLLNGAVWLLRPFLAVERAAIRRFLTGQGERWLDDPSNNNPQFERVRIRERSEGFGAEPASAERLLLARRAADFLARSVRAEGFLFAMDPPAVDAALADPAAWRGLLLLAAMAGGRVHTLEARSAQRLRAFLASGTLSRLTAGRVVFDRRRDGLSLYREARGIGSVVLPAGAAATWDDRYTVTNLADRPIVVSAAGDGAGQGGDDGRRGPALRASRAAPRLSFEGGGDVPAGQAVIAPRIAPYAGFLPSFDLPIAQALAEIAGRKPFPSSPNG